MEKKQKVNSAHIAGKHYNVSDYDNKEDTLSSGLAVTHEQVSDNYMEGTIDAVIEREDGTVDEIPKKGYE
ncbi:YozQ family protein [Metabacillus fastidiosus]|uniref:YozQ family protein n=1 Tax=Metabacillus fastidiosus TaxID=1458 RepID=A0ABU6P1S5_9BACI|nr:YozQ family protein [Metabacillus fastidiosus]MED4402943.1 YozQ family protein [Metabacillus fastidiosus]MED4454268.1 YozQ family protein [Metabacillus fastidiosus]MED4461361.1 YozQ family protein [Metabacillus fastidiosus]MED4533904.1 YozQ family protein [Metabacillus fastidiosus]